MGHKVIIILIYPIVLFFSLIDLFYKGNLLVTPEHHIFVNDGETDFAKNVIPNKTQIFISNDGEKLVPVTPTRIAKVNIIIFFETFN
jgi:hypothetical protein